VPRRVYTSRQLEHAADATRCLLAEADGVRGLRIRYEAPVLRHFTARFEHI
jgi:tryptophanase